MPSKEKEKEKTETSILLPEKNKDTNGGHYGQTTVEEDVEAELADAAIVKPPDGGYGWVVVAASFLANVCVDGIIFTVGAELLPAWKKHFNTGDTQVSLTMSILAGSYLLCGPVASAFANAYGCRAVVIAGAIISFFGFIMSTVAPEIYVLYLSFGLVGGIGFGFIYLPSLVIVSHYFDEKRALATGLAVCGSGIGTSIFAQLNPYVMKLVGGSYVLFLCYIGGITLLCVLCGLLYKPLTPTETQIEKVTNIVQEYQQNEQSRRNSVTATKEQSVLLSVERPFDNKRPFLSTLELTAAKTRNDKVWSQRDLVASVARESVTNLNRPLSRADVFYPGSTQALNMRSRAATEYTVEAAPVENYTNSNVCLSRINLPSAPPVEEEQPSWSDNLCSALRGMIDVSLLRRPSFLILAFSGFLTLSCFYVPYNYLENHIERLNVTDSAKKLPISVLGVINIVARIGCGYIADRPQVDALLVSNIALIAAGVATVLVPFYGAYWMFIAFCVPFALGAACFAALRTVICAELYGLEKLSSAFGILLMFMGFGALVGSPIAAMIKDVSGNFDISFYVMGTLMALSGVICVPLRKLARSEIREKESQNGVELGHVN